MSTANSAVGSLDSNAHAAKQRIEPPAHVPPDGRPPRGAGAAAGAEERLLRRAVLGVVLLTLTARLLCGMAARLRSRRRGGATAASLATGLVAVRRLRPLAPNDFDLFLAPDPRPAPWPSLQDPYPN